MKLKSGRSGMLTINDIKNKSVGNMSANEKEFARGLFVKHFMECGDVRKKAIGLCVVLGGVPVSKVCELQLIEHEEVCDDEEYLASKGRVFVERTVFWHNDYLEIRSATLKKAIEEYVMRKRGFDTGNLFYQRAATTGGEPVCISPNTVGRVLRLAAEAIGLGGTRQIQFHRLADASTTFCYDSEPCTPSDHKELAGEPVDFYNS